MPLSRLSVLALGQLLLLVALSGCASSGKGDKEDPTKPTKYDDPISGPFEGDDLYTGIPSHLIKVPDDEVNFSNEKDTDYELIAKWATERRDLISWCLHEHVKEVNDAARTEVRYKRVWPEDPKRPQTRLDQAIAIGNKVIEKIPGNTRERARLAYCLFTKGTYEYWAIDACMNRINVLKAKIGSTTVEDEDNPKFPKESKEIRDLRMTAADASWRLLRYHKAALTHFNAYLQSMPMDKAVLDFIWKIHFQLADFREAVRVMNQLLEEDLLKEEVRADYLEIRREINEYLVEREINKDAPKPGYRKAVAQTEKLPE
jgi:tetratricopeptide (TPR) repeat protein